MGDIGVACITLTTDFGTRDHYVGAMKGVLCTLAPGVTIVDVTHDIAPMNIAHAAFVLRHIWHWYPPGSVHVAVVDPGVGSSRRILLGKYGGQYVVAPDNGLISIVHREVPIEELRVVENLRLCLPVISNTFHGRDIMAPVAARLASGQNLPRDFGPVTDRLEVMRTTGPSADPVHGVRGTALFVDRFGNLVSNIRAADLQRGPRGRGELQVYVNGRCVGPIRTRYADVQPGEPLALIGSSEHLEISVNQGSAADKLGLDTTAQVEVR